MSRPKPKSLHFSNQTKRKHVFSIQKRKHVYALTARHACMLQSYSMAVDVRCSTVKHL